MGVPQPCRNKSYRSLAKILRLPHQSTIFPILAPSRNSPVIDPNSTPLLGSGAGGTLSASAVVFASLSFMHQCHRFPSGHVTTAAWFHQGPCAISVPKWIYCPLARIPSWYDHLARALAELQHFPAPTLSRPDVERLLSLSRRDAIRFLHRCGAKPRGDRLEVSKDEFARQLQFIVSSTEYQAEMRRRQRVAEHQAEAARQVQGRRMVLPFPANQPGRNASALPDTVRLYRTRLVIDFPENDVPALLGQLLEIARTARDDPEGFQRAIAEGRDDNL